MRPRPSRLRRPFSSTWAGRRARVSGSTLLHILTVVKPLILWRLSCSGLAAEAFSCLLWVSSSSRRSQRRNSPTPAAGANGRHQAADASSGDCVSYAALSLMPQLQPQSNMQSNLAAYRRPLPLTPLPVAARTLSSSFSLFSITSFFN